MAAASVVKGIGSYVASRRQSKALKGQATEEENAGAAQSLRIREQARRAIGDQLAGQSSNGFLGGTGTALDSILESQTNAALDAMMVQRDAATKARALRSEAKMRRTEGYMGLASGLVGAAGSIGAANDDWAQASRGSSSSSGS